MPAALFSHLWQSTLFAAAAGLLTLALKKNRARTRYWVWFIGLVKFLVPFGLLVSLGSHFTLPRWTPKAPVLAQAMVQPAISFVIDEITQPAFPSSQATSDLLPKILLGVWACGFVAIAFCWGRRWTRINADVRSASRLPIQIEIPVVSSPVLREPGVFGIFRPVLMLPDGMAEHLTKAEWDAILAHELCHVRCYDNLTAVIYMLVESIFWFHPLVWWMGTRLVAERERACDEEVLRLGSEPKIYAEGILKVCELYLESPLECVAGVTGSNLRRRIRAIMTHQGTENMRMMKKLMLAAVGTMAASLPIVVGLLHAQPAADPRFEVASIRPCQPGQGPLGYRLAPGRFRVVCMSVEGLIGAAYVNYADAAPGTVFARAGITGGPDWIKSDQYDIEAKAEGNPTVRAMGGPMLRALLEDRFKLKLHRETKEIPVYELTVAKGGFKLKPLKEGCTPTDSLTPAPPDRTEAEARAAAAQRCNSQRSFVGGIEYHAATLDQMAAILTFLIGVDRPVVNRAGIAGIFDYHLAFTPDDTAPRVGFGDSPAESGAQVSAGSSIFTAIQEQLGLKLEPAKAPGTFLVIDSVERPSEN